MTNTKVKFVVSVFQNDIFITLASVNMEGHVSFAKPITFGFVIITYCLGSCYLVASGI